MIDNIYEMNFQQLSYILAVHEHKHFGRAAESCHITQATLSGMIKKLESELNLIIFDRSKQPVQTTDLGLQVITNAQKILSIKNAIQQIGTSTLTNLDGKLHLGVIPTIANSLLPIILPTILKNNPKLKLHISEITTEEIKQQLILDKIDIGILATPLEDEQLEETILYYEPMMLYGVKDTKKKYISSADVKDRKIWLLEEGNCFRNQAMSICNIKEKSINNSNLNFSGSSFDTLLNMSDQFGGYTLVPELFYKNMSNHRQAITKSFEKPIPVREISLVHYRPFAKKQTVLYLEKLIKNLVNPTLSTVNFKPRDLSIIGI